MTTTADAQDALLLQRLSHISHLLLVLSGKGGVGKSSVSVQFALSLLALNPNARIGLLDVDLTGPSLPRMLGMEGGDVLMSREGWVPVYLNGKGPHASTSPHVDAAAEGAEAVGTVESGSGFIACMSIGFLLGSSRESVVWRGPKKNAMIKQFLAEVRWGELDYLIVDTPPGTSDEHITLLESLRPLLAAPSPSSSPTSFLPLPTLSAILVSTPQALALLDVSKELSFVRRTELPLLGLIENMSGYVCPHCSEIVGVFGKGGGEEFCKREEARKESKLEGEGGGCRFLGRVPVDRELVALLDGSEPVALAAALNDGLQAEMENTRVTEGGIVAKTEAKRNLVERYELIPSFKIFKEITERVVGLIQDQKRERDNAFAAAATGVAAM